MYVALREDDKHNICLLRVLNDIFAVAIKRAYPGIQTETQIIPAKVYDAPWHYTLTPNP